MLVPMKVDFTDRVLTVKFPLDPESLMGDDVFWEFCMANRDLRIELPAEGEFVIVPPPAGESDHHACRSSRAYICGQKMKVVVRHSARLRSSGCPQEQRYRPTPLGSRVNASENLPRPSAASLFRFAPSLLLR